MKTFKEFLAESTETLTEAKLEKKHIDALAAAGYDKHNSKQMGVKGDDSYWIAFANHKGTWVTIDSLNGSKSGLNRSELNAYLASELALD